MRGSVVGCSVVGGSVVRGSVVEVGFWEWAPEGKKLRIGAEFCV